MQHDKKGFRLFKLRWEYHDVGAAAAALIPEGVSALTSLEAESLPPLRLTAYLWKVRAGTQLLKPGAGQLAVWAAVARVCDASASQRVTSQYMSMLMTSTRMKLPEEMNQLRT